jgi:hypothetical protein
MSTQEYDRWYIVPAVTVDAEVQKSAPKYADRDGIERYIGKSVARSVMDDHYPALNQTYPDVPEWYIVRFYGSWSALNNISVLGDTRNLATNPQDIGAVLSQRLPDVTVSDWGAAFFMA